MHTANELNDRIGFRIDDPKTNTSMPAPIIGAAAKRYKDIMMKNINQRLGGENPMKESDEIG